MARNNIPLAIQMRKVGLLGFQLISTIQKSWKVSSHWWIVKSEWPLNLQTFTVETGRMFKERCRGRGFCYDLKTGLKTLYWKLMWWRMSEWEWFRLGQLLVAINFNKLFKYQFSFCWMIIDSSTVLVNTLCWCLLFLWGSVDVARHEVEANDNNNGTFIILLLQLTFLFFLN